MITVPPSPAPPPSSQATAVTWFGQMSMLHRPGRWLPVLLVLTMVAYHAAWLASGEPYSRAAAWTVAWAAGVGLLVAALVRAEIAQLGTCVRVLLAAEGIAATVLGADLVLGRATAGTATTTDVVGALAMLGGCATFAAGVYLRTGTDRPSTVNPGPGPVAEERLALTDADGVLYRFPGFATGTNRLVEVCRPLVTVPDLHYLAYHVDGECRFTLDVLDDPRLGGFFDQATPQLRRHSYRQHGRYLFRLMVGLNDSFQEIDSGTLIRVVLDVERGALYYYWIDARRYVIGVTLDQEMVDRADRSMVQVVDGIRAALGHKKIGDLER